MKKIILLLFIIFASCSDKPKNFSEKDTPDSLAIYFRLASEQSIASKKRLECVEKAHALLKDHKNDSLHRENLFMVANKYFNLGSYEKYQEISKILAEDSQKAKDSTSLAKAYSYMADYYAKNFNKSDSAFICYIKAIKIYKKLNISDERLGNTYVNLSLLQTNQNDLLGAETSAIEAIKLLKENKSLIYQAYNIVGIAALGLEDHEKAIEYHTKALKIAKDAGLTAENEVIASINNIGGTYQSQQKHKEAIEKFEEALRHKNSFLNTNAHATLLDNLGYSKLKLGDHSQLPDLFYQALKIRDSLSLDYDIVYNKLHLCEFYNVKKDTLTAQKFATEALALSREIKSPQEIVMALSQLIEVDSKNASKYGKEYIAINDSLMVEERKAKNQFARLGFETDDIILEKEIAVQRQWLIFIIAGSIVLFGLLLYIIRMQRIRQKESILIQSQQKASEEIYQLILDQQIQFNDGREKEKKRIAKELHDGVMNKLAGIRFNLFVLQKKTDPETISKCISHISEIESIEKEIRNITHDLHQDVFFAKNDYAELLETLTNGLDESVQINTQLKIDENINWEIIPAIIKMHSYRILQESISNAIKHSNAKNIYVCILKNTDTLLIEIKDDGTGFDTMLESASLGIKNIKYRAAEMNGKCEINSSTHGTIIAVTIPLKKS